MLFVYKLALSFGNGFGFYGLMLCVSETCETPPFSLRFSFAARYFAAIMVAFFVVVLCRGVVIVGFYERAERRRRLCLEHLRRRRA